MPKKPAAVHDKLAAAGGELLERTLIGLEAGTIVPEKQDDSQAGEYARMLDKELGILILISRPL